MTADIATETTSERHAPPFHVVTGQMVADTVAAGRADVFARVAEAYRLHAGGASVNPDSYFLRFPEKPDARIIALPAWLGGDIDRAGLKWISSFPANRAHNLARASAVMMLNDYATGYPLACLEASLISAHRTAASAALAAEALTPWTRTAGLAVVGTGVIARTTVEWLLFRGWIFTSIRLFDADPAEARRFAAWLHDCAGVTAEFSPTLEAATRSADLVLFATTAGAPHVHAPDAFGAAPTVLHLSLRDISVEHILAGQNILDDVEHCMKAQTSPHLAEQRQGNRAFIAGTLADVLSGGVVPERRRPRIFSPFGLGVLDIAVADYVLKKAIAAGTALEVPNFFSHANRW